jgi:hypothetical protein
MLVGNPTFASQGHSSLPLLRARASPAAPMGAIELTDLALRPGLPTPGRHQGAIRVPKDAMDADGSEL